MLAYLFPGQGSQSRGMGAQLFDEFPELVKQADEILGYSIQRLCLDDSKQQLNQTQYTQPAIYVVNALSYFKKLQQTNTKPDFVLGHSLGEYNALLAAGVFDFATGLLLVKKRGELMSAVTDGAMAAVVGLTQESLKQFLQQHHLNEIVIANYNTYLQSVISGAKQHIQQAQSLFADLVNVSFISLNVSGAFHSFHMLPVQQQFDAFLQQFTFATPDKPVIANIDALTYHPMVICDKLSKQIAHPVQWVASMEYLLAMHEIQFEEIGAGRVLTGLLNRIKNKQ